MRFTGIAALPAAGLLTSALALSQKQVPDLAKDALEKAYAEHLVRVQRELPPHSGLPCLLGLSKPHPDEDGAGRKWEDRFMGSMGVRQVFDPGVSSLQEATSISTTTNEYIGPIWALPAGRCDGVVIATPTSCNVHLAYNWQLFVGAVASAERKTQIRHRSGEADYCR